MAETRLALTNPRQTTTEEMLTFVDNLPLPLELWPNIFQHLEPSFLNSILRTCRRFNEIAKSDAIANPLLSRFYPDVEQQEGVTSFSLFKPRYTEETRALSRPAKTLWDLCFYNDVEQFASFIARAQLDPDMLFEEDPNHKTILAHINNLNRQDVRDQIFQNVHAWFVMKAKEKASRDNFLGSLFYDPYKDSMSFDFETRMKFFLLDFAIALNQLPFIQQHSRPFTIPYPSNSKRLNLFQSACLFGHLDIIKYMLANSNPFEEYSAPHRDPLSYAVIGYQEEVVEFLLVTHRDNITNDMIRSATHLAVSDDRLEILEILLRHINDILQLNYGAANAETLLGLACQRGQADAGKLIANMFPALLHDIDHYILCSVQADCGELVEFFLSDMENIPQYLQGYPYLVVEAAASGSTTMVNYLLDRGSPIDGVDVDGDCALHVATTLNHLAVVQLLVKRGADMSQRNAAGLGLTALELAKKINDDNSIALFLMDVLFRHGRKRKAEADPVVDGAAQPPQQRPRR